MSASHKRTSKFMSLLLRHRPEAAGLRLDAAGYVAVDDLMAALNAHGHAYDRALLEDLVALNDKQRFAFDETGTLIRAVQGHSRDVDLGYAPAQPPQLLYHGTVAKVLDAILAEGLAPRGRQFVHLSGDEETAQTVGRRRGRPVILTIDAGTMFAQGHVFHLADNGVWLTAAVPAAFISCDTVTDP